MGESRDAAFDCASRSVISGGQARDVTINASTRCSSFSRRIRRFSHRAIHSGFADKSRSEPRSGARWVSSGAVSVTRSRHFGHWTFFRVVRLTVKTLPHAGHFCSRLWALIFIVSAALGDGERRGVGTHRGSQEFAFLKTEEIQRSFLESTLGRQGSSPIRNLGFLPANRAIEALPPRPRVHTDL